jgi:peptide deformylase
MLLELVEPDNPILRTKAENFNFENPPCDINELCTNLLETMYEHNGVGLSANQVGLPYRVFCMRAETPFVCFNPRIVLSDPQQVILEEGCLSFPQMIVKVSRPKHIKVRFATPSGTIDNQTFTGMSARIFQHELSHLNGEFFFDGIGRLKMEMALKKAKKAGSDLSGYNLMKYAIGNKR